MLSNVAVVERKGNLVAVSAGLRLLIRVIVARTQPLMLVSTPAVQPER